jgi:polysaccharide biosynthesis protein PslG
VNVNRLFDDQFSGYAYTPGQIGSQLQALRETGVTIARSDTLWEATEPVAPVNGMHRYTWSFDDSVVGSLAAHRLRLLAVIDYSAPWAQSAPGQDHSPPRSPDDYAEYAGALAARYGAGGLFWRLHPSLTPEPINTYEVWNEPDIPPFWFPAPNAGQYVELYLRARDAITAVDPAARVIVGGLANAPRFLPAMLAARPDLAGHIDGVGIHPYGANPRAVLDSVRAARKALTALGIGTVPLYATEFGWTTKPPGARHWVPERVRPRYISRAISDLARTDCGLAAAILYTWLTPERDPGNLEDWFGIHPLDGGSSSDTQAFAAGLRDAASTGRQITLCARP